MLNRDLILRVKPPAQIVRIPLSLAMWSAAEKRDPISSIINKPMVIIVKIVIAEALHKQTKRMSQRSAFIKTQLNRTNMSLIHQISLNIMTMDLLGEPDREESN